MSSHRSLAACIVLSALLVIPASVRAESDHVHDIVISNNREFDRAHGVTSGRGTKASPYVFNGVEVDRLTIQNTNRAVKIVNSSIGTLTLNFIGPLVEVVDNGISDLRVNENVPRTGAPTGGRFVSNWFGEVGQIRHFDGRFAYNRVGFKPEDGNNTIRFGVGRAVNFDGFNGAMFDHNIIYGSMDARLHGHHHSSMFGSGSHMHTAHHDMVDHTVRYHEVKIFANRIEAAGAPYALAYLDINHADNDRTAPSETNTDLEKAHLHRTKVSITGNTLSGSGLLVDVFNADDEIHRGMPQGWLTIADNRITLQRGELPFQGTVTGIDVYRAQHLSLRLARNSITGPGPEYQTSPLREWTFNGEGILLQWLDHANVMIDGNSVISRRAGIRATQMTSSVHWTVRSLRTSGVSEPISYDESVANAPRR